MAEAIISRATTIPESLPIAPGYHTVGVTVRDYDGKVVPNFAISCNDGGTFYNYTTNEKGKTIFMVNSGAANIYVNNYANNGIQYLDFEEPGWFNLDAPVGLTQTLNINFAAIENKTYEFLNSTNFLLLSERSCNICIIGGGGGGGSGYGPNTLNWGTGGGSGYMNNYYNQSMKGEYNFISGEGGNGGWVGTSSGATGYAGGTSYIENTNYSAAGGEGGGKSQSSGGGNGGLGNGAYMSIDAGNSPVDFAGGGGGIVNGISTSKTIKSNGSPYGGSRQRAGGGYGFSSVGSAWPGKGGNGLLRIEL